MDQWTTLTTVQVEVLVCHRTPTTWSGHRSLVNITPIQTLTVVRLCIQTIRWIDTDLLTLIHISDLRRRCTQGHPWAS